MLDSWYKGNLPAKMGVQDCRDRNGLPCVFEVADSDLRDVFLKLTVASPFDLMGFLDLSPFMTGENLCER